MDLMNYFNTHCDSQKYLVISKSLFAFFVTKQSKPMKMQ